MQESRKEKPSSVHKVKPPEVIESFYNTDALTNVKRDFMAFDKKLPVRRILTKRLQIRCPLL
jgi:hypothetical protein